MYIDCRMGGEVRGEFATDSLAERLRAPQRCLRKPYAVSTVGAQ